MVRCPLDSDGHGAGELSSDRALQKIERPERPVMALGQSLSAQRGRSKRGNRRRVDLSVKLVLVANEATSVAAMVCSQRAVRPGQPVTQDATGFRRPLGSLLVACTAPAIDACRALTRPISTRCLLQPGAGHLDTVAATALGQVQGPVRLRQDRLPFV